MYKSYQKSLRASDESILGNQVLGKYVTIYHLDIVSDMYFSYN